MPEHLDHDDPRGEPMYVDRDGVLTERRWVGGEEVVVHHDDIPEADTTVVRGIPCTTALRTVIDLAPELDLAQLEQTVRDCLDRHLFTLEEAWRRLAQPDMSTRHGAELLRQILPRLG